MPDTLASTDIHAYLKQHEHKELLRFLACGSVDDGKSTLIGRLLFDSKMVYEDQLASVKNATAKHGTTGTDFDPALLTDGLRAEREQGITIDVAHRYFSTTKRKFIICDTPGHEQYTRNMVTGASHSDLAVILIDARHGVLEQTRRHSFIASLLGIQHVVVAVNKMDLMDYSEQTFEQIKADYTDFSAKLELQDIQFVPISALDGDNVVHESQHMPWYTGSTLMHILENVHIASDRNMIDFRLPVQYVNRPDLNFRGFCGTMGSGIVRPGDEIMALPSKRTSRVDRIVSMDGDQDEAFPPQAVTLTLEDEIDVSRGDLLAHPHNLPRIGRTFEAMLVWMDQQPLNLGTGYYLKHTTRRTPATVTDLRYQIDVNSLHRLTPDQTDHGPNQALGLNEIGRCVVELQRPIAYDPYHENHSTGSFILIDRLSHNTVAAGMILEHDPNVVSGTHRRDAHKPVTQVRQHESLITHDERASRLGHKPATVWLTGLTGAGKSAIAFALERRLFDAGYLAHVLDGRNARLGLSVDLHFSDDDRAENLRRSAEVAHLFNQAGLISICAFLSPGRDDRAWTRNIVQKGGHEFFEVWCNAPQDVCAQRIAESKEGGVDAEKVRPFAELEPTYEPPDPPDQAQLILPTHEITVEESVNRIMDLLARRQIIQ